MPMMQGLAISLLAEGSTAAAEASSGPDWWTLAAGLLGGLVVAVANHLFTRSREHGAWLKKLQIDANRDFYASAQAVLTHVTVGHFDQPAAQPSMTGRQETSEITRLTDEMGHKAMNLLQVGEESTVDMVGTVSQLLPPLAYQATPLSRTNHAAGLQQRKEAMTAMGALMEHLALVMRKDIGLLGWRKRLKLRRSRKDACYHLQALSPVDRPNAQLDLTRFLSDWEIRPLKNDEIPTDIESYHVDQVLVNQILVKRPEGFSPQALALKVTGEPWRLGLARALPQEVQDEILRDVVRVVAGHQKAFDPKSSYAEHSLSVPDGSAYVWANLGQ